MTCMLGSVQHTKGEESRPMRCIFWRLLALADAGGRCNRIPVHTMYILVHTTHKPFRLWICLHLSFLATFVRRARESWSGLAPFAASVTAACGCRPTPRQLQSARPRQIVGAVDQCGCDLAVGTFAACGSGPGVRGKNQEAGEIGSDSGHVSLECFSLPSRGRSTDSHSSFAAAQSERILG